MKTLEQARKAVEDMTLQAEQRIKDRLEARLGRILTPTVPKPQALPTEASSKR